MIWKILTTQIREKIYYSLTSRGLFPDEQKGCHKRPRGTAKLLYIDQHILNESKARRKNLAMAWIDYKKAYDMVPTKLDTTQSQNVQNITWGHKLHRTDHESLESGPDSRRKKHSWNKIQIGIFQGDALTPLLFMIPMMPPEPLTQKMRSRILTQQVTGEDQQPNVHWWH